MEGGRFFRSTIEISLILRDTDSVRLEHSGQICM